MQSEVYPIMSKRLDTEVPSLHTELYFMYFLMALAIISDVYY